jgi:hypothetical protein
MLDDKCARGGAKAVQLMALVCGTVLVSGAVGGCGRMPPKPPLPPSQPAAVPAQEDMPVNFDAFMHPKPTENIILSNPKSTMQVCRLIVASNTGAAADSERESGDQKSDKGEKGEKGEKGDKGSEKPESPRGKTIATSGTAVDDYTLRVIRREAMLRQIEVTAGEVAARIAVEPIPSISGGATQGDGLSRYEKIYRPAERLVLLAEQTGAQAMLVLDEAGVFYDPSIVEFDKDAVPLVRDKRGAEDNPTGCQNPEHPSFNVLNVYVGVRAKLVSLKRKEHAAILADVELLEPLSDGIGTKGIPKWRFEPRLGERCRDFTPDPFNQRWDCVKEPYPIAFDRFPSWCEPLAREIDRTTNQIKALHWQDRYAGLVKKLMDRLFPVIGRKCGDEAAAPAAVVDDKKPAAPKLGKGKPGGVK